MCRRGRPSPSPGGVVLGGGADNTDGEALGGCPTIKSLRAETVLLKYGSLLFWDWGSS